MRTKEETKMKTPSMMINGNTSSDEEEDEESESKGGSPSDRTEQHSSTHSYSVLRRIRSTTEQRSSPSHQRSGHWSDFLQSLNDAKEEATMELRGRGTPDL
ncbi:hypothetical protein BSL78_10626 [Apostichopus japonicus]|uniref:Uncharacterized protein n=1 Tax=Stichopus japonicus TaxID=307972 RepID=A0A2G8KWT2_STIJA|nr:hypothetical protein BSL78_10626 [Apostichopus japonicus]